MGRDVGAVVTAVPCCVRGCTRTTTVRCGVWTYSDLCDRPVCVVHGTARDGVTECPECASFDDSAPDITVRENGHAL